MEKLLLDMQKSALDNTHELNAQLNELLMQNKVLLERINILNEFGQNMHTDLKNKTHEESQYLFSVFGKHMNVISDTQNLIREDINRTYIRQEEFASRIIRNSITCRWQIEDALSRQFYHPDDELECPVCKRKALRKELEKKKSFCVFGGGVLERYRCPGCGGIYGPSKMLDLNQDQLGEEYRQSYSVYSETNCTKWEKEAFFAMQPVRGKKYLNYGGGAWNQTTQELRKEGFDVYTYEPFAPVTVYPWILTSKDQLSSLQFDGIFSNDLVEHLRDPIAEFKFMGSLLVPAGIMSHATSCYEYAFEYTRFHIFFFTGDSLAHLCKATGFDYQLSERIYPESSSLRYCLFRKK